MANRDLLIIIPAYNEEKNIVRVLEQLEEPEIARIADILVINDASKDRTNVLVKFRHHAMVTHVFNLGYGSALQLGYKYAVRRGYRYVIQMDADGQHDPCNIPVLYEALLTQGADGRCPDIVIGSRFVPGAGEYRMSAVRRFAHAWFRGMIRMFTGVRITDPTSGLQGLSRRAFLYYSQFGHFDDRYPDANMLLQMLLLKYHVREAPAVMHARTSGTSMHSGLKPAVYMIRMTVSILAVEVRYGLLKEDKGVGENDAFWTEEEDSLNR